MPRISTFRSAESSLFLRPEPTRLLQCHPGFPNRSYFFHVNDVTVVIGERKVVERACQIVDSPGELFFFVCSCERVLIQLELWAFGATCSYGRTLNRYPAHIRRCA